MTPVRLEPAAPQSRVKHSTTELPKCSVIVYNEDKYDYMKSKREWHFGNDIIKEDENYKHLGFINNKYLS